MTRYHVVLIAIAAFVISSCGKSGHTHEHEHASGDSASLALDGIIMSKHDEVMPKSEDLYNLKKRIQDTIAATPKMDAAVKAELTMLAAGLDSARMSMEEWMHTYDPKTDSADLEKNRTYMENQIEKINKIGEQTTEVIDKTKAALKKK